MKKSSQLAEKVYKILFDNCSTVFEEACWREWHVFLRNLGIECKGFDNHYDQIEEMMRIINDRTDKFVICSDPWVSINQVYGHEGFLIIPIALAEKIAVLQGLPGINYIRA